MSDHMSEDAARKKMAHVIAIGIAPEKGEKSDPDSDDDSEETEGSDPGLVAAMEEFLTAAGKKDAKAMAEAFASASELCR